MYFGWKKLFISLCIISFSSSLAIAQIDIGQNDNPEKKLEQESKLTKSEKTEDKKEIIGEEEKKSGLFSFMNFSFNKKKADDPKKYTRQNEKVETFVERITREAEEGKVDAQLTLGYMYLYGENGVKTNYKKAFRYYSMAAAQNDIIALNNLGSLYFSGIGVSRDANKAVFLFNKAALLGNSEAAVNLAFIYLTGNGANKNYAEAMKLFSQASQAGNPTAKFMLGYAYYKGFSVKQNYKKAFELVRDAANAQYDDAQYVVSIMYLNGSGVTKNYGNAVKYLTSAAMQGNVEAMVELGNILAAGVVYNKDIYKAHIWYNIASVYGAKNAALSRDGLEKALKIDEVLAAQAEAEKFKSQQSEITSYIKQTFGEKIRAYIDEASVRTPAKK